MLTIRVIPRLDITTKRTPLKRARELEAAGADELWLYGLDREQTTHVLKRLRPELSIPIAVESGPSFAEARDLFEAGADRVLIPARELVTLAEVSELYGATATAAALDAIEQPGEGFRYAGNGEPEVQDDPLRWAQLAVHHGAGEIALTTRDAQGAAMAPDGELTAAIALTLQVPLVAVGITSNDEGYAALSAGADAVQGGAVFRGAKGLAAVKKHLAEMGIEVRP